jgi:hypothetical protein
MIFVIAGLFHWAALFWGSLVLLGGHRAIVVSVDAEQIVTMKATAGHGEVEAAGSLERYALNKLALGRACGGPRGPRLGHPGESDVRPRPYSRDWTVWADARFSSPLASAF